MFVKTKVRMSFRENEREVIDYRDVLINTSRIDRIMPSGVSPDVIAIIMAGFDEKKMILAKDTYETFLKTNDAL